MAPLFIVLDNAMRAPMPAGFKQDAMARDIDVEGGKRFEDTQQMDLRHPRRPAPRGGRRPSYHGRWVREEHLTSSTGVS